MLLGQPANFGSLAQWDQVIQTRLLTFFPFVSARHPLQLYGKVAPCCEASWFAKVRSMTVRENIQIFHQLDIEKYLKLLEIEQGAKEHPAQPGCYLVDNLPFYKPKKTDEYVNILGFNLVPLPSVLLDALVNHPEMIPDETTIVWTIEQDLFLQTTIGEMRNNRGNNDAGTTRLAKTI
jgi:hypothetical protein